MRVSSLCMNTHNLLRYTIKFFFRIQNPKLRNLLKSFEKSFEIFRNAKTNKFSICGSGGCWKLARKNGVGVSTFGFQTYRRSSVVRFLRSTSRRDGILFGSFDAQVSKSEGTQVSCSDQSERDIIDVFVWFAWQSGVERGESGRRDRVGDRISVRFFFSNRHDKKNLKNSNHTDLGRVGNVSARKLTWVSITEHVRKQHEWKHVQFEEGTIRNWRS